MNITKKSLIYLFAIEGILFQFIMAINNLGNAIYATNLGASDTQIGFIQAIPNLVAILFMIPIGMIAENCKSTKTVPIFLLCIMGISYMGYATVPVFGEYEMIWFFIFLGISLGFMGIYNAQWQLFFGSVVKNQERNRVYSVRNQFMYFVGAIVPFVCGFLMTGLSNSGIKVSILRVFFYICAASLFLQAIIIRFVPGGRKDLEEERKESDTTDQCDIKEQKKVSQLAIVRDTIKLIIKDKKLRVFFGSMLFFYATWQIDWSMWYIGQVQYVGMSESQLGYYNGLASICQMLTIGFFARMNVRKGLSKTWRVVVIGLIAMPVAMAGVMLIPSDVRAWSFVIICVILAIPQGCVNLIVIQMILNVLPKEGQSVMLSIYTLMITLSNCIFPLLGVKIYLLLGANLRAFLLFLAFVVVIRVSSYLVIRKRI